MKNTPPPLRLTVIVPVLNEACRLSATLRALEPLHRSGMKTIVVGGGSDDRTLDIAAPLADLISP